MHRAASVARVATAIAIVAAILIFESVPFQATASEVAAKVGGCGSGFCDAETAGVCASVGDGCGNYEICQGDPAGQFICTPKDYCTARGCTVVHGGMCN